jgi:hypothetical protein
MHNEKLSRLMQRSFSEERPQHNELINHGRQRQITLPVTDDQTHLWAPSPRDIVHSTD